MVDDILGHDHLDHGPEKDHHHENKRITFTRGSRPRHIALPKKTIKKSHIPISELNTKDKLYRALPWIIGAITIIPVSLALWKSYPALATVIIVLLLNTLLEYHKYFTEGAPVDLEILFASTAYVGTLYNFGWAMVLVVLGPVIAAGTRGRINAVVFRKSIGLLATALASIILSPTPFELLFAVLLGVLAHYGVIIVAGVNQGVTTIIARISVFGLNAYLVLFIIPTLIGLP